MRLIAPLVFVVLTYSLVGQKIKTDLVYLMNEPTQKTTKTPVLIMLHGYGANEEDLFEISKALDPRLMTFSLRGTFSKSDGGYCWYNLNFLPNKEFTYNYEQAKESKMKIMAFIRAACKNYKLDSNQVYLIGFSQGAIMSYELAASEPSRIKGVIALSGRMMEETKQLKTDWDKVAKVKYFIAHGISDNTIKISEGEKASIFLKEKKATDVTFKVYEMPHSISGAELNDIKSWLTKALNPKPASAGSK